MLIGTFAPGGCRSWWVLGSSIPHRHPDGMVLWRGTIFLWYGLSFRGGTRWPAVPMLAKIGEAMQLHAVRPAAAEADSLCRNWFCSALPVLQLFGGTPAVPFVLEANTRSSLCLALCVKGFLSYAGGGGVHGTRYLRCPLGAAERPRHC